MQTKCYLDMDGVLANLFDFISIKILGKEYKAIETPEEKLKLKKIWTDKDLFIEKLGKPADLFINLSPYSTNDVLINKVIEKFNGFYICSSPAKMFPDECILGKLRWIGQHIIPKYSTYFKGAVFPRQKSEYAMNEDRSKNILIDDYQPYIDSWEAAGGIPIKLQSSLHDSQSILKLLEEEFKNIN
jgi:5'(3')-deoxyribonucleotidase